MFRKQNPPLDDCTEVLEDESKSILLGIIAQLGKGMDLHRVTLPTFVLEPRSMLERITDFMSHPDLLLQASIQLDPVDRFLGVVQYFLSGWHIKPKGVKKPYNPILGEHFKCQWDYPGGATKSRGYYLAEQVSHHPPRSAYYYANPECGIYIQGELCPRAKFLGNSAATLMEVGKMVLELGDKCKVHCPTSDLICELDFKTKGFFSGQFNSVTGKIKQVTNQKVLYDITGQWTGQIYIIPFGKEEKTLFFDAATATPLPCKHMIPIPDQDPMESRRLWGPVTRAILSNDLDQATHHKTILEEKQRQRAKERVGEWQPRYFSQRGDGSFEFNLHASIDPNNPSDAEIKLISTLFTKDQQSPVVVVTPVLSPVPVTHLV
ncbi:hypothetical protein [Absidia glauca]|uniref:Oxysterol-binding protein n=1 Tax=Absidia glauca TaxID=4829 RepID=A0A168T8F3_ABSGL|nr:hypothetical protein [Absidia glauca]